MKFACYKYLAFLSLLLLVLLAGCGGGSSEGGQQEFFNVSSGDEVFLSLRAFDSNGVRSTFSNEVSKILDETGTIQLTWQVPTQNTDSTCINELAGYEIAIGSQSRVYDITDTVELSDVNLNCQASGTSSCGPTTICTYSRSVFLG